jgi:hypothetical protein
MTEFSALVAATHNGQRAARWVLTVTWLFLLLSFGGLTLAYRDLREVRASIVENRQMGRMLAKQLTEQNRLLKSLRADEKAQEARYLTLASQMQTVYTIVTAEHHKK